MNLLVIDIFQNLIDLTKNGILLFGLALIYAAINFNPDTERKAKKILAGLVIGIFAMLVMMNPWQVDEGLYFDTRSVLMGVTGLFFGPFTTIIAGTLAIIYRISLGGLGIYSGVLTILATGSIGLYWFKIKKIIRIKNKYLEYYIFGFIIHFVAILCFLAIPWPQAFEIITYTALPFLVIFPVFTMILALVIENQKDRLTAHNHLKKNQQLLQASIDAAQNIEIYALDTDYRYLSFNQFHYNSMRKHYGVSIKKESNFLSIIENPKMKERIKNGLDEALLGRALKNSFEVETTPGKHFEELYQPIYDDHFHVTGVTVFSQDITERVKYEESILHISYHDALTDLGNRRYYMEKVVEMDTPNNYPLSVVLADINGLKMMNDAFGHEAGDLILKVVTKNLISVFDHRATIARIGGDEFVMLLANTTGEETRKLIEKVKASIEAKTINGMYISVSFGLSTKTENQNMNNVLKLAENDMYKHKLFEVASHRNEAIKTILNTLLEKNPREKNHSQRVSEFCLRIGKSLGMNRDDLNLLKHISNLHDIGKIAIPDAILNKKGKLTEDEWIEIKRHPEIGYRILSSAPEFSEIALDILSHHERYDGKGYPRGIKGEDIPMRARIISIADAYDAMTSERPYRDPMTHEAAIKEIESNAGTQFDPKIARIFIDSFKKQKTKASP